MPRGNEALDLSAQIRQGADRHSPLKVDATAVDNQSTQDNENHNRGDGPQSSSGAMARATDCSGALRPGLQGLDLSSLRETPRALPSSQQRPASAGPWTLLGRAEAIWCDENARHVAAAGALIGNEALVVVSRRDTQQLIHRAALAPRA